MTKTEQTIEKEGIIMYDVKSKKAEEFIDDQEILDTLAFADAHKNDRELIKSIIYTTT